MISGPQMPNGRTDKREEYLNDILAAGLKNLL